MAIEREEKNSNNKTFRKKQHLTNQCLHFKKKQIDLERPFYNVRQVSTSLQSRMRNYGRLILNLEKHPFKRNNHYIFLHNFKRINYS